MRPTLGNNNSNSGSGNTTRILLFGLFLAAAFVTSNRKCWDFSANGGNNKNKQLTVNLNKGDYLCTPSKAPRPVKTQLDLAYVLEEMNFTTGAMVGVNQANFARGTLSRWSSCQNFKLIFLQDQQHDDNTRNKHYQDAQNTLEPWRNITQFFQMHSSEAASRIKEQSLDYIYMDAHSDYCGALEDFTTYWPFLKPGGIMAGQYIPQDDRVQGKDQSLCTDGVTVGHDAVKGAVTDFFYNKNSLMIGVTYMQTDLPTWYVQKPLQCGGSGNNKKGKAKH